MKDVAFREYDIRGRVGSDLCIDQVYDVGCALAYYFLEKNPVLTTVAIGMDCRTHSPTIKDHLVRAMRDSGLHTIFIGVVPSPVLYFALHTLPVQAGLMVTASHNPKEYNGIKVCLGTQCVWGKGIGDIRDLFASKKRVISSRKGTHRDYPLVDDYVTYLAQQFDHLARMQLPVVIDCANGAAGAVIPELVLRMQWQNVHVLYPELDGTYPHHEADPVVEKNMQDVYKVLRETDAIIGVGLDGDADRMGAMTKDGYLVPGDKLLALFACHIKQNVPDLSVVYDIKSSAGLAEILSDWGIMPCMAPSGHAIIKEHMREKKALLGGELSCHFIFKDRYLGYDDGIYAMMRLFEIVAAQPDAIDTVCRSFPHKESTPELRIECPEEKKQVVIQAVYDYYIKQEGVEVITIDGVRASGDRGWAIVRCSNTQPAISIRCEGNTIEDVQQIIVQLCNVLEPYLDTSLFRDYCTGE